MKRGHWIALALIAGASLVAQLLAEPHTWWERIPGFYAGYGFLGAAAILLVARWIGRLFHRDEDYYDRA